MSVKSKIEKDFQTFNLQIQQIAAEEIERVRTKLNQIKSEAERTGEEVERSIDKSAGKTAGKKS